MRIGIKKKYVFSRLDLILAAVLFVVFAGYYAIILLNRIPTDLQPHAKMAYTFALGETKLPPNFLYFFLVALLSGFSKNYAIYYIPTAGLLSAAIVAKFFITKFYAEKYCIIGNVKKSYTFWASIAMIFVFALPGLNYFLSDEFLFGQLVSNVWHNSTTIFLMPFSVLLFFKSYSYLYNTIQNNKSDSVQIILLLLLNALVKPSFLFTLLPSVFLIFFSKYLFSKEENRTPARILPYIAGIFFILIEYYFIYKLNFSGKNPAITGESGIAIEPFVIWKSYSPDLVVAFITSCFFPLVYIIVSKGKILQSKLVQFSICNYLIGLGLWILLTEQGFRRSDGNFIWQMVVTGYLLFFTLLIEFLKAAKLNTLTKLQQWIIGISFFLHFAWGVFYWLKIIIFKEYS